MKDLHIHIERGEYSREWIEKFVKRAEEMNIKEINLLEHSVRIREFHPCFKEACDYSLYQRRWFNEKKEQAHSMEEFRKLIVLIRSINYPVKVNFGMEVCWFEQHSEYIRNLLSDGFFDYIIGSVHWIDNWTFNQRKYQWLGKDVNKIYKRYYEMNESLCESGIFDIMAHPDLIRCQCIYPSYDLSATYENLCKTAVKNSVAVEMNTSKSLGLNSEFLEIAKNNGVMFSTGSDAHRPEDVGRGIKEVYEILKEADIL